MNLQLMLFLKMKKMKKLLLLAFMLFLLMGRYNTAKAQEYIPIPLDSTMWKVNYWNGIAFWNCYIYEYTAGDTIINGISYVLINRLSDYFCLHNTVPLIKRAAIRQDSAAKKVYIIQLPDSLNERILYDFTQQVGDTCNSILNTGMCGGPMLIVSIDSVLINGRYHRRLNTDANCSGASLIEGVGSTFGLIDDLFMFEGGSYLICAHNYHSTDSLIYVYNNLIVSCDTSTVGIIENPINNYSINIYPNPFEDKITFEFSENLKDINFYLFDVYARIVYEEQYAAAKEIILDNLHFNKGIYFFEIFSNDRIIKTGKVVKN